MTNREALDLIYKEIIPLINLYFRDAYPDTFVKSSTRDKKIYQNANPSMYGWYTIIINRVSNMDFSPKYSKTMKESVNSDWSCVNRFYQDLKDCDDWLYFIINNVNPK